MIKLTDLLDKSEQTGHISKHNPARAFAPESIDENADQQLADAKKIFDSQGIKILQQLENMCKSVEKAMGSFMYPGFKAALHDAIIKSIKSKRMIDSKFIASEMKSYFLR
tara:strand:+ start:2198 stop:2527 length:330 start_codon:yes stop_codon:yes gene_type:complete